MPHPPIILHEVGQGEERKIHTTIDAMEKAVSEIAALKPDTVIITSPHAPAYYDGFFVAGGKAAFGNLEQFGVPASVLNIESEYDFKLAEELKRTFKAAPLASPHGESAELDHASLIPLYFLNRVYKDFKVLRLGLSGLDSKTHYELGQAIQKAADNLNRRSVFIASGDLSHVLKSDGPYGFQKEGPIFDEKLTGILAVADFKALLDFPEDLIQKAAQCGINSFRIMAGALDGLDVKAEKYAYEGPFGVGYAVFSFEPGEPNPQRKFLE